MVKIQELSQQLANQIAAGEVVERPASVVKELLENALDAGSTKIEIFVEEAGLKKIQIIDNGEGIEPEDVLIAFKRHATSKISTRDDLFRIRSLGFRGEALPSIASVSEIKIETSDGKMGTYAFLSGGELREHRPNSLRQGTSITVEHLFFNTPARLKYVKTLQTELANIGDVVNRLALSHPNVSFRLVSDGNELLKTTGNGDLKQTIANIYGVPIAKKMKKIQSQDLDFKVQGYVSFPELTRASRNYISVMVNGRYIKNYAINKSIISGYGSKLMVGRFPIAILSIDMDPLLVDVNVHPTKQEVRLSKESELTDLIQKSIAAAFREETLIPEVPAKESETQENQYNVVQSFEMPLMFSEPVETGETKEIDTTSKKLIYNVETGEFHTNPQELTETEGYSKDQSYEFVLNQEIETPHHGHHAIEDKTSIYEDTVEEAIEEKMARTIFPDLDYIGQMHGTYLLTQSTEGLYIIDQHAAQERIKYEYFREMIAEVGNDRQPLLIPIVLEYSLDEYLRIKEHMSLFDQVGIELEEFGQNSFVVRSYATWFKNGKEEETVREMIDVFLKEGKVDVKSFREKTAIMMSCKQSIKANHYLDDKQAIALLQQLKKCKNPFNCPHGRPVLVHFTNQEMEKMFKRIQDSH